jgi:hypothetical protein
MLRELERMGRRVQGQLAASHKKLKWLRSAASAFMTLLYRWPVCPLDLICLQINFSGRSKIATDVANEL